MPDDRLLHRCQGFSSKLAQLDHLAYRVWTQYLLSADDFGVCPDSAALLRGANLALAREPEDNVRGAIDQIVHVGLVDRFDHQGQHYLCSREWQDYQSIRWPRTTYYPAPPPEVLQKFSRSSAALFRKHSTGKRALDSTSGRVNHRLTAKGKQLISVSPKGESEGDGFDAFYAAYPRGPHNQGPIHARKVWKRLHPDADLQVTILAALDRQKRWPQWLRDGGQYIPTPQKWLHEQRWMAPDPDVPHLSEKTIANLSAGEAFLRGDYDRK